MPDKAAADYQRFEDATKAVVSTPKKIVDQKVKEQKEQTRKKRGKKSDKD